MNGKIRHYQREALKTRLASADPFEVTQMKIGKHTSELQSHSDLVCRLLLEKKKQTKKTKQKKNKKQTKKKQQIIKT